ncbi:diaminopimelate epimerase [Hydrogenobacter hydrogenophilus]|uniref:Diaminopimelate epimerase n=1 Tax=Hydrogenobacter hydrogenophilus TaxID=35835 RepID=A0A285NN79_9AQUI|nr:diaminopimelate epimerase [Hydrogenobacter hydrogenophilus]SNZ10915.1 diaminopimelate epimerase [Hydrogenobacter hydrogenophilus]
MRFVKLHGSGNDFVVFDNRQGEVYDFVKSLNLSLKEFVVKVCAFHTGVGADGLILIENPENYENHFKWQFFNSDGSVASMCGNGSRCAVRFAYEEGIVDKQVRFETLAGVIHAEVLDEGKRVKVLLTKPNGLKDVSLRVRGTSVEGSFINTGVPHFVMLVDNLESFDVISYGREIRFHQVFEPGGTNVDFIKVNSEDSISIRTYERGVENETLACGTGAVASAIVAYKRGLVKRKPVEVRTKGGDILRIDFDDDLSRVFLEGSVYKVFDGFLHKEAFYY